MTVMVAFFLRFLFLFPDAPIHPCGSSLCGEPRQPRGNDDSGYCGKQGQPRSYEDYVRFLNWETAFSYLWPLGLAAGVLLYPGYRNLGSRN